MTPPVSEQKIENPRLFFSILLLVFSGLVWISLLVPLASGFSDSPLRVGAVAPYDIRAPFPLTFESAVLTERQRDSAANLVTAVYSPPDITIARQQLERLRAALIFISNVRQDAFASNEQKLTDLAALEDLQISRDLALQILPPSATPAGRVSSRKRSACWSRSCAPPSARASWTPPSSASPPWSA